MDFCIAYTNGADVEVEISTGVKVALGCGATVFSGVAVFSMVIKTVGVAVYPMVGCIGVCTTFVAVALGTIVAVTLVGQ